MTLERAIGFLRDYPTPVRVMEVCGTHTSAIVKSGLRRMVSPNIRLVSGPGCPVCVTPAEVIDALIALSTEENTCVLSVGDLFRVPGSRGSFVQAKASGGRFRVIYSPLEALALAETEPFTRFVVAAVGFETTIPVYAVLLEELERRRFTNIRLLTALKTMPAALDHLCGHRAADAYLCPGHVSAVTGSDAFARIAEKHHVPFAVAGVTPEHILAALCHIVRDIASGGYGVRNLYPSVVTPEGNAAAQALMKKYLVPTEGVWRGIGRITNSALVLRPEYAEYAVECPIPQTADAPGACRCGDVMLGRADPDECALFGKRCTPGNPVGACMVSSEGACGVWYTGMEGRS